jgi:hypothetical protein
MVVSIGNFGGSKKDQQNKNGKEEKGKSIILDPWDRT